MKHDHRRECREEDMIANPTKGKKLTNMRASGTDENIVLTRRSA